MLSGRCPVCLSVCLQRWCIVTNGSMDQDATWYGGRPRLRTHCVRWGSSCPKKEHITYHFSAHVYCDQTAGWIRMPLATEVDLGPGHIVLDGEPSPHPQKGQSSHPLFSSHVDCGQTVAHLSYCSAFVMAAMRCRCGHYIFSCGFYFLFFLPNLRGRRLDICHTSTHCVP